ncbi:MAG: AAA family ATPase [Acidobacteria bacterium]|nr:AAA family ATPase [Acidobacteriota bacterium]
MNLTLEIPDPSLILLIGSSGAGKSTFAARHFLPTEIISSDRCRALISDDESDQTINAEAFGLLHHITRLRLQQRKLTVVDATNLQFRARRPLLRMARAHRVPLVAIVFQIPLEICLTHNQARPARQVEQAVLELHQQQLAAALSRLDREGYSRIYVLEKSRLANSAVKKLRQKIEAKTGPIAVPIAAKH